MVVLPAAVTALSWVTLRFLAGGLLVGASASATSPLPASLVSLNVFESFLRDGSEGTRVRSRHVARTWCAVLRWRRRTDLQLLDLAAQHLHDVRSDVQVGVVQLAQHERIQVGLARALLINVLDVSDHRHVAREEHRLFDGAA